MTRISMSLAAVSLTLTLAPSAQAYAFGPEEGVLPALTPATVLAAQVCPLEITPLLADVLGLVPAEDVAEHSAFACNAG